MTFKNKILAAAMGVTLITGAGCKKFKDFGTLNENPNQTAVPITSALLASVMSNIGGTAANTRGGLYAQQFSETQYTETSLYAEPKVDFDATYIGPLMDLQNIINVNSDPSTAERALPYGSNANQIATSRILKAYYFWILTDQYGDIPYFTALKGAGNNKYDTQESIYKDIIKELREAAAQFDGGLTVKGDVMYGGDVAKWKKFANSLRMLVALRMSKAAPALAQTEVAAAASAAGGLLSSNADNARISYPGGAYKNPWFALYDGRSDFAMSNVIDNFLTNNNDPRLAQFGSNDVGFPYGLTRAQAVAFDNSVGGQYARILKPALRAETAPITILNYAVILFAQAEARQRGWITTGPTVAELYKMGIQASWAEWGVTGDVDAYIAQPAIALTAGTELQKIAVQRWLATYPNGLQAWFEWRRTGFPVLTPTPNATNTGGQIPRRYVYGTNEYGLNADNVKEAAARIGGDTQDTRIWIDK
jgi:hypothetical protein